MKKVHAVLLIIILCALMTLTLFSCNNNDDEQDKNQSSEQSSLQSTEQTSSQTISRDSTSTQSQQDLDKDTEATVSTEDTDVDDDTDYSDTQTGAVVQQHVPTLIDTAYFDFEYYEQYENEMKGWGQGVHVDELNRPTGATQYQDLYGDEHGTYFIHPTQEDVTGTKVMYITFDEGYENGYTPVILDALKEYDCPSVFFVTLSYVKSNPELIQRMIDEGHAIGNHSVSHPQMPSLTSENVANEIVMLHNYMVEEYNYQMTLFRPPEGAWSTRTLEITKDLGYTTVFWSYAYRDWEVDNQMGVEEAFPKVSEACHDGAIYLLHAVSEDNAEMMGDLIQYWRAEGFELKLLD